MKPGELPESWGVMVQSGSKLRAKVTAPRLRPEPLTLDFIAGLTAAAARTASRESLHRDARTIDVWSDKLHASRRLCQACGEPAPCALHQPRTLGVAP